MVDTGLLALALEDFLPVVLSGAALWMLARTSLRLDRRAGRYVAASFVLITAGGVTKPIYKLLLAVSGGELDVVVLDDVLFWCLAPGFLLLAAGLRGAERSDRGDEPRVGFWAPAAALAVVLAAALTAALGSEAWFFLLLAVATVGNVWAVAVLVRWARSRGDGLAAGLFAASLLIVLGLAGAAARLEQTIPVQWGEQLFSTAAQGTFLWGAWRLTRQVSAGVGAAVASGEGRRSP